MALQKESRLAEQEETVVRLERSWVLSRHEQQQEAELAQLEREQREAQFATQLWTQQQEEITTRLRHQELAPQVIVL